MHTPSLNGLLHGLFRLVADCRGKVDEDLSILVLGPPRAEGVAQKVELGFRVITSPVVILAVDNAGLIRVDFQSTLCQPFLQVVVEFLCILQAAAVRYSIVGIASKRFTGMVPDHPRVKRIVEKQIG